MKWKLCQEILKSHTGLFAVRSGWPQGLRVLIKNYQGEWGFAVEIAEKLSQSESVGAMAELIKKDLDLNEAENIDWIIM